jgi:hypothetical protein
MAEFCNGSGVRFSLSPRERAGVRGKEASGPEKGAVVADELP